MILQHEGVIVYKKKDGNKSWLISGCKIYEINAKAEIIRQFDSIGPHTKYMYLKYRSLKEYNKTKSSILNQWKLKHETTLIKVSNTIYT